MEKNPSDLVHSWHKKAALLVYKLNSAEKLGKI